MSLLGTVAGITLGNMAGSLFGSATQAHYNRQAMEYQERMQERLFEFENRNKHQFEVDDLRAAGLNPILSATNGNAVGVGGISMGNAAAPDNVFSSAKQLQMAKEQLAVEQQNADSKTVDSQSNALNAATNAKVGESQSSLNAQNMELAKANTNSAIAMLPWMELQKQTEIKNSVLETAAKVAYYNSLGSAALQTSSATAAAKYQDIKESQERSLGYAGQRTAQDLSNRRSLYDMQFEEWKRDLQKGNRFPSSAYDLYRGFMGK